MTEGSYDGLDIVRTIPKKDLNVISDIHFGGAEDIPESLKRAVCWFVDCVACMRLWKYGKPVSMLIHTSRENAPPCKY